MSKKKRIHVKQRNQSSDWNPSLPSWLICVIICLVGVAIYSNTFESTFHFDDETSIINNVAIRHLNDPIGIFHYSAVRFMTYLSFAVNYRINGLDVGGYHVVNLLIHLSTALLVGFFARQILHWIVADGPEAEKKYRLVPLIAALIFVAHPVQTQGITYIVQRAASLATFFYITSLYLYGVAREKQMAGTAYLAAGGYFAGALMAGILAVFSKETAFTLPLALGLYEICFIGSQKIKWGYIVLIALLLSLILGVIVTMGLLSLEIGGAIPARQYLLTQPMVLLTYLRLFIFPINQILDYDFPISRSIFEVRAILSIIALASVIGVGFGAFKKWRMVSFGIMWFLLTLLPESSFIPMPDVIFEHRLYLPMVGLSICSAFLISDLTKKWTWSLRSASLILLIGALSLTTYERNKVWADDFSLWTDVIKKSPGKARGYQNMGRIFADRGLYSDASENFKKALMIDPVNPLTYNSLANVLLKQGQPDAAIVECNRALALGGGLSYQMANIYLNRGTAYLQLNRLDSALADLNAAINYDPGVATAFTNRGIICARIGQPQQAIDNYSSSIALDPGNMLVYTYRASVYKERGQLAEALSDYTKAISLQTDMPQLYYNRGTIFSMKGQFDQAIEDFSSFARLRPKNVEGYYYRGLAYAQKKSYQEAISDFSHALSLFPFYRPAYVERAKVYLALNQNVEAEKDLKSANAINFKTK
jgi:protein O-mannosyl-transferase